MIEVPLYVNLMPMQVRAGVPPSGRVRRVLSLTCVDIKLTYRGTSIIRNSALLRPYSRNMPRAL